MIKNIIICDRCGEPISENPIYQGRILQLLEPPHNNLVKEWHLCKSCSFIVKNNITNC